MKTNKLLELSEVLGKARLSHRLYINNRVGIKSYLVIDGIFICPTINVTRGYTLMYNQELYNARHLEACLNLITQIRKTYNANTDRA